MKAVPPVPSEPGGLTQPASSPVTRNLVVKNSTNLAAVEEQLNSIELLLKDLRKRVSEVAEAVRVAAAQQPNGHRSNGGAGGNGRTKR